MRKHILPAVPEIYIAGIRDIVIDYLVTNREMINVFRNIIATTPNDIDQMLESNENTFHYLRVILTLMQWELGQKLTHGIIHVVNALDEKYDKYFHHGKYNTRGSVSPRIMDWRDRLIVRINQLTQ